MGDKGQKTMYRWHFAVWASEATIATALPEHQSAVSSRTFSPGGKNPASKAFLWTTALLNRRPNPGERVNLDPFMPLPCRIKIERTKNDGTPIEYARVIDLEGWPEGLAPLTPALRAKLVQMAAEWQAVTPPLPLSPAGGPPPGTARARAENSPPILPTSAVNPGMVGWSTPQGDRKSPSPVPTW